MTSLAFADHDRSASPSAAAVPSHAGLGVSRGTLAETATPGKAGAGDAAGGLPDAIRAASVRFRASSASAGLTAPVVTGRLDHNRGPGPRRLPAGSARPAGARG